MCEATNRTAASQKQAALHLVVNHKNVRWRV
jgi:hypothetical protein